MCRGTRQSNMQLAARRCLCRSTYPETLWAKLAKLFSEQDQQPVAVDIAVGSEGRPGVELARR